jgi:hypothetical protein
MQFWSPYFKKSELLIPYFKSQLFGPPSLIMFFWSFGPPTIFGQIFCLCVMLINDVAVLNISHVISFFL